MKIAQQRSISRQAGFSLIELAIVCTVLAILMVSIFSRIQLTIKRSQAEQTKVDLTQQGRDFVDEFERDLHQAGYPNCRLVATAGVATNCPVDNTNPTGASNASVAVGLVSVSNTQVVFEGDVDGNGTVDEIVYRIVDGAGNYPPSGTCPCTLQRSQMTKVAGIMPLIQAAAPYPTFSQELQNVVNSGVPTGSSQYGGGLPIAGNTAWGATNTSYYAAISSFKDYPIFQAYDQNGLIIAINPAVDISTPAGTATLTCSSSSVSCVKSIRLTINLLANATTGTDLQTKIRPVTTLVGSARLVNN